MMSLFPRSILSHVISVYFSCRFYCFMLTGPIPAFISYFLPTKSFFLKAHPQKGMIHVRFLFSLSLSLSPSSLLISFYYVVLFLFYLFVVTKKKSTFRMSKQLLISSLGRNVRFPVFGLFRKLFHSLTSRIVE